VIPLAAWSSRIAREFRDSIETGGIEGGEGAPLKAMPLPTTSTRRAMADEQAAIAVVAL
jgi:hypothetical protein